MTFKRIKQWLLNKHVSFDYIYHEVVYEEIKFLVRLPNPGEIGKERHAEALC